MKVTVGRDNRLYIESETPLSLLKKGPNLYSCKDTVMNRLIYGVPVENPVEPFDIQSIANPLLRPYQVEDIEKMLSKRAILNANDMGMGKTVESIELCRLRGFSRILVICPKSVIGHWENQFSIWYPSVDVQTTPAKLEKGMQVVVTNYAQVRVKFNEYSKPKWDAIICDEAHRIKNHKSQIGKMVHKLKSRVRMALTGTPITNLADDLFNILKWVEPSSVGNSYWAFVNQFCHVVETPFGTKITGLTKKQDRLDMLYKLLGYYMVRRRKVDVLSDLLGKNKYEILLQPDKKQAELYNDVKKLVFDKLPEHCTITNGAVHLLRLLQVTSNPELFNAKAKNPKFEFILDMLRDNPTESIVVFSNFAQTVDALEKYMLKNKVRISTVIGGKSNNHNSQNILDFKNGKTRILCGTIGAMGQGIDGLQHVSNTMVFIDMAWSPQINEQAEDRIYRIGQDKEVSIYCLRIKGSVDTYVGKRLENKEQDVRKLLCDI